jgi:hypothetical protein
MVFLTVNGKLPGDELALGAGPQKVQVKVEVRSQVPVDKVELVVNGQPRPWKGVGTLDLDRSAWIAARATGPWHRLILNDAGAFGHTSPVYVSLGGAPVRSAADAAFYLDWIDKLIARVRERGQFTDEARRREVIELFAKARAIYEGRK